MLAPRLDGPLALQGGRMTKADLVEKVTAHIARTAGPLISKKDCARVVDSFLDAVKAALAEQHNIEIRGFGTFKIRQRKTRMARNPRTGDPGSRRAAGACLQAQQGVAGDGGGGERARHTLNRAPPPARPPAARTNRLGRFVLRGVATSLHIFREWFVRQLLVLCLPVPPAAQSGVSVKYEVSVPSPAARLSHVSAEFPAGRKDTLYVSLPAWSPGNYEIQNYAKYVRHFAAKTPAGRALFWDRLDKDTWRVATGRSERVTVEFDYLADTIDLSSARIVGDFGQFLGTNLFMFEEGQWQRPGEVRFSLPAGWQVTTALKSAGGGVYTAPSYHELVDAETFVGKYSLDSLQADGRWIRIAVWPADAYTPAVQRNMRTDGERIAKTENAIFGGPPYDAYTVFFNVIREPINFGGGLEHSASQFDIMPQGAFADAAGNFGDFMIPLMSHEYFHLFNVKRIRPAEMWPYDYHAEQYTPLLWWSECGTDHDSDLTNIRSWLWTGVPVLGNYGQ